MKVRTAAAAIGALTFLNSGCGLVRNFIAVVPLPPSISFRTVSPTREHEAYFYQVPAQTAVFKSQEEVDSFLAKLPESKRDGQGNTIPESLPVIDFAQEQGVIVLFGAQPHGGYGGTIAAVEEKTDRFIVHSIRSLPSPGGIYAQMVVFPYHYIAMPRSEKPVEFAPTVDRTSPGPWWSFL